MNKIDNNYNKPTESFWKAIETLHCASKFNKSNLLHRKYRIVRWWNDQCTNPILKTITIDDVSKIDITEFESSGSTKYSVDEVKKNNNPVIAHIMLNYIQLFGSKTAITKYYNSGVITKGNDKGIGICHLVKRDDYIKYLKHTGQDERSNYYYLKPDEESYWMPHGIKLKSSKDRVAKEIKKKVWFVIDKKDCKDKFKEPFYIRPILKIYSKLIKLKPNKYVLDMDTYVNTTYRWEAFRNFKLEFSLDKK